jgi:predicted metal-dependent hydrolase
MKLPFELIDYVIIHELSHTKQMNHGPSFWALVGLADPNYKNHRRALKLQNPSI